MIMTTVDVHCIYMDMQGMDRTKMGESLEHRDCRARMCMCRIPAALFLYL